MFGSAPVIDQNKTTQVWHRLKLSLINPVAGPGIQNYMSLHAYKQQQTLGLLRENCFASRHFQNKIFIPSCVLLYSLPLFNPSAIAQGDSFCHGCRLLCHERHLAKFDFIQMKGSHSPETWMAFHQIKLIELPGGRKAAYCSFMWTFYPFTYTVWINAFIK